MATISQIDANRQNSQSSTGPRTESGKAASSTNALTLGLFTRADYVKPEERPLYKEFCESLHRELAPDGILEQSLAAEITGATWRLRRCSAVEADLADYAEIDPMLDESTEKTRRALERARSHAHSLLHRSINQLRKLQTDRACREVMDITADDAGIADYQSVVKAAKNYAQTKELHARASEKAFDRHLASICNSPDLTENEGPGPGRETDRRPLSECI
jgi:ElaB/YqjD/DUF883 family membrane-anchored ribosome-binding protein